MKFCCKRIMPVLLALVLLCVGIPTGVFGVAADSATSITVSSDSLYAIDTEKGYVMGVYSDTTVSSALAGFNNQSELQFVDSTGSVMATSDVLGTGCKVQRVQSGSVVSELTIVVNGDTDGDGIITVADAQGSYLHMMGKNKLTGAYAVAAKANRKTAALAENRKIDLANEVTYTSVNNGVVGSAQYIANLNMVQLAYDGYFSIGTHDLSKYSSVVITYGVPANFDADAEGMPCIMGIKSQASSYGWATQTSYNLNGDLGHVALTDGTTEWANRKITIDLADANYNGEVFVTAFVSNGTVQGVFGVELIGKKIADTEANRPASILDVMSILDMLSLSVEVTEDCPAYNMEKYTSPYWNSDVIYNEAVMPLENQDGSISSIQLMYNIRDIVSVRNAALDTVYTEGTDYVLENGKLKILPTGSIDTIDYSFMYPSTASSNTQPDATHGYMYFAEGATIHNMQLAVTYVPNGTWGGAIPAKQASLLPKTMAKLEAGEDLKILVYGDSISVGANATGFVGAAPYAKNWYEMVVDTLNNKYEGNVTFVNNSKGGEMSAWGLTNVQSLAVAESPDLVFIGFGMNDGSQGVSTATFKSNIQGIMNAIKASNPNCEFVLISSMLQNPDWPTGTQNQPLYLSVHNSLKGEGVAVADITSMHQYLLTRKRYIDMTGNHVNHPNDFLVRVYAQVMIEVFK